MRPDPTPGRRAFLAGTAAAILLGCKADPDESASETGTPRETGAEPCADPFEGGALLGLVGFLGEDDEGVGYVDGVGLDGRLAVDLTTLDEDHLVQNNDAFYVRTLAPSALEPAGWTIPIGGLVAEAGSITADELAAAAVPMGVTLLECSGNSSNRAFGLISAAEWSGVPVVDVLARVTPLPSATRVRIRGFDEHPKSTGSIAGAAWVFTVAELVAAGAFFATEMNGAPLPADHGGPVRLVMPGWFGCTCIKWVDEIVFVDDSEPATSQMLEFAERTHQVGKPSLARDYLPAKVQQAAMPVRVEQWEVAGEIVYRIVGVLWGGEAPTDKLVLSFNGGPDVPVTVCPAATTNRTWTLWSTAWRPEPGLYTITCHIDDDVPQVRLDDGYYARAVMIG